MFIPYVERMNASLAYFKGFAPRQAHPGIDRWLSALEQLETYRGTQSDVHTHAHDLPPQMGGCWADGSDAQRSMAAAVDAGQGLGELESRWTPPDADGMPRERRWSGCCVIGAHCWRAIPGDAFDQPLRAALTELMLER